MKKNIQYFLIIVVLLTLPIKLFGSGSGNFSHPLNPKPADTDILRTEVRIKIIYEGRMVTPLVEVFINDVKTEAVFDTGSYGLRVLKGALTNYLSDSVIKRINYAYGDDKRSFGVRGCLQPVTIHLGNLKSNNPIGIMCIDSSRYGTSASWNTTGDSAAIQSNHFRSVAAIMGVGLRAAKNSKGVANPLAQLPGNGKYIVQFPYFGGSKGKLILNPDTADLRGFTLFKLEAGKVLLPNGDSSWRDNELWGCALINNQLVCQFTMLDTGNPDIHIRSKNFSGFQSIPAGNKITLILKDKTGITAPVQTGFITGSTREHGKDYIYLDETGGNGRNIFGTPVFFNFDVLYDQVNGIIGLRRKH